MSDRYADAEDALLGAIEGTSSAESSATDSSAAGNDTGAADPAPTTSTLPTATTALMTAAPTITAPVATAPAVTASTAATAPGQGATTTAMAPTAATTAPPAPPALPPAPPAPNAPVGGPLPVAAGQWQLGQPMPQPLAYLVPTNATGGTQVMTIPNHVNFWNRTAVNNANKLRNQNIRRRGFTAPKRPSTQNRAYTGVETQWAINEHHTWATNNGNRRIPLATFTANFNARFAGQNRSQNSLSSFISRNAGLAAVRQSYAP